MKVWMRFLAALLIAFSPATVFAQSPDSSATIFAQAPPSSGPAATGPAHAIYDALTALRVNAHEVYTVKNLDLRRDIVHITFTDGKLAFLEAYQGKIVGAVFSGRGHIVALPREPGEKESLARFIGTPILDEEISNTFLRFDDNTEAELREKLKAAKATPADDPSIADEWNPVAGVLNRWHSLRLLSDFYSAHPQPYFYAGMEGALSGPFDVLIDDRREEQVMIGQPKNAEGQPVFDSWVSAPAANAPKPLPPAFDAESYSLDTTILPDLDLEGSANITLRCSRDGERILPLQLSNRLRIESVAAADGTALEYFQSDPVHHQEIAASGNDALTVILPAARHAGDVLHLRIAYQGRVIADAGNGVFYVGERGSWYPHGVTGSGFASFDMHFRWPHQWQLVATGNKVSESETDEWREGQWRTDGPYRFAGFNLGQYHSASVDSGAFHVDLYADAQLEQSLQQRLRATIVPGPSTPVPSSDGRMREVPGAALPVIPPSPTAQLTKLGQEISEAAHFFEQFGGPFPFRRLEVSQAPGGSGQGWPGLIYLPTFSFLSAEGQRSVGLASSAQQHFSDVVPYHELAHQWWGNLVSWDNYRDQWISEGLANYVALLFVESRRPSDHELETWLERYRKDLLAHVPDTDAKVDEVGPLSLGYRLRSSVDPDGYEEVIYPKSTWVFHMLREMLRDPKAADPDLRFKNLLKSLVEAYRNAPLSTDDLQRAVERLMTPSMDLEGDRSMTWFFDEWVRSTGIPHYKVDFTTLKQGDHYVVKGTLHQSEVPARFIANVPLYAGHVTGKPTYLGHIVTDGRDTRFQFRVATPPKHIVIDPELTLLCQPE